MSKIYDFTIAYRFSKEYASFTLRRYYGKFIVIGKENIPADSPVIFAPNHTNALMDALAVAASIPHSMPVVFLARADLFKDKTIAGILRFMKIMPAFRMRDGINNLGKNEEIFEQCKEVLHTNHALCIMPEGNQETERKLRPLVKGIFRIAFSAQQKYGNHKGVKIIPVGLDFGSLTKANKHIIVHFGEPIEVADYMPEFAENQVTATNRIKEQLRLSLSKLSLNLASDKYYPCFETAVEVCQSEMLRKLQLSDNIIHRHNARKKVAEILVLLEKHNHQAIKELSMLCHEYELLLANLKLRDKVFEHSSRDIKNISRQIALALITLPIAAYGLLSNFFPFFLPVLIRKYWIKPEFEGFISSLQYALGIITFPIFYLLQTALIVTTTDLTWWGGIVLLISFYPAGKCALKWNSRIKKTIAALRFKQLLIKKDEKLLKAILLRKEVTHRVMTSVSGIEI